MVYALTLEQLAHLNLAHTYILTIAMLRSCNIKMLCYKLTNRLHQPNTHVMPLGSVI